MSRTTIEDRNEKIDVSTLKPLGDYVLVKTIDREKTASGILISGESKATELCLGEVVALGSGPVGATGRRYPFDLSIGDMVITMGYIGERMELRSGKYRFVHDHGIWAKVGINELDAFDFSFVMPRFRYVLVEMADETMTRSGTIWIGENKNSEGRMSTVISVGPGIWNAEDGNRVYPQVKPGDHVIATRYAGADITVKGKNLRLLNEADIRCFTEEE